MTIKEDLDLIEDAIAVIDQAPDQSRRERAAVARIRDFVESAFHAKLARAVEDWEAYQAVHAPTVLRSGEPAEVIRATEQAARSWIAIQNWLDAEGAALRQMTFEKTEIGTFVTLFVEGAVLFAGMPCVKRSDALAQAAQWCLSEGAAS